MQLYIAQVAAEISANQVLINNGVMGTVLIWLLTRGEKLSAEIKLLGGRIDAMTRAMLVDVISRESTGVHAKQQAREIMAEIESNKK